MRYVAAYLLAALGGKAAPTAGDIDKILSSVGIESDSDKVQRVINSLKGKSIEAVVAEGKEKLCSMPTGGAAPAAASSAAPVAVAEEKKESKKEEKKQESESEDEDLGFGLFD